MSTDTPAASATARVVSVVSSKTPVILAVLDLVLAIVLLVSSRAGTTTFRVSTTTDLFQIPDIAVPAVGAAWVLLAVCVVLTAESFRRRVTHRRTPPWVAGLFALSWILGFLSWAAVGSRVPVVGLFAGAVALAIPLVFGALGGVLGERSGVVNIAIEAQLLFGSFAAAVVASMARTPWVGLVSAMAAGVLVAALLGLFAITYKVDQVIVGVVLNVLVIGLTNFLFRQVLTPNAEALNSPERFSIVPIPILGQLPLVGPVLFRQTPLVYLLYLIVAVVSYALYRTRWGLRVRAVGEHPTAADTVGIRVNRTRWRTILLAGAIAGLGGAYFSLVSVSGFNREMTGGAGFIALAAVIFGKWDPIRATLAALLFGFASNLQGVLSVIGSPVPSQFMLMLPYVVTIFAVAGLVGRSRPPAADGVAYTPQ